MLPLRFSAGVLFGLADNKRRRDAKDAELQRMEYARMLQMEERGYQANVRNQERAFDMMAQDRNRALDQQEWNRQQGVRDQIGDENRVAGEATRLYSDYTKAGVQIPFVDFQQRHRAGTLPALPDSGPDTVVNVNNNMPGQGGPTSYGDTPVGTYAEAREPSPTGGDAVAGQLPPPPNTSQVNDWMTRTTPGSRVDWDEAVSRVSDPERRAQMEADREKGHVLVNGMHGPVSVPPNLASIAGEILASDPRGDGTGQLQTAIALSENLEVPGNAARLEEMRRQGQAILGAQNSIIQNAGQEHLSSEFVDVVRTLGNAPEILAGLDDLKTMAALDGQNLMSLMEQYDNMDDPLAAIRHESAQRLEQGYIAREPLRKVAMTISTAIQAALPTDDVFESLAQIASGDPRDSQDNAIRGHISSFLDEMGNEPIVRQYLEDMAAMPDQANPEAPASQRFRQLAGAITKAYQNSQTERGQLGRFTGGDYASAQGIETMDDGSVVIRGVVPTTDPVTGALVEPRGGFTPDMRERMQGAVQGNGIDMTLKSPDQMTNSELKEAYERMIDLHQGGKLEELSQPILDYYRTIGLKAWDRGALDGNMQGARALLGWIQNVGEDMKRDAGRFFGLGGKRTSKTGEGDQSGAVHPRARRRAMEYETVPITDWNEMNWLQKFANYGKPGI